jgi:hypothetical protein
MQYVDLKVIEENGWSKQVSLSKAITLIGSAANCDVQLNSRTIAPVQLQLLSASDLSTGCRLVNLSGPITFLTNGVPQTIAQFGSCDVHHQDELKLGEFRIVFELPLTIEQVEKTSSMEASLSFSNAVLRSEFVLEGKLVVKNLGKHPETQFQVELQGLPVDCFQIDPIPLLYPGALEEIRLRLFHHSQYPEAGLHTIFVIVTAANSYPGEELVLEQRIYVSPVFNQTLEILDEIAEQQAAQKSMADQPENEPFVEDLPQPAVIASVDPRSSIQPTEPQKEEIMLSDWPPDQISATGLQPETSTSWNWNTSAPENLKTSEKTPIQLDIPIKLDVVAEPVEALPEKSISFEDQSSTQNKWAEPGSSNLFNSKGVALLPVDPEEKKPVEAIEVLTQPQPTPSISNPDRSKLKIMRHPSIDIWNED